MLCLRIHSRKRGSIMSVMPVTRALLQCRKFSVKVDEALERAILEAKQIRSEVQEKQQTHIPITLPISQIQSLIRAGADPARVAERYSLSEALVRRFSASVETEKQYAIEQFLAVPAPKESVYVRFPN